MNSTVQADSLQQEILRNLKRNTVLSYLDGSVFNFANGMVPVGTVLLYYLNNFVESNVMLGLMNSIYILLFFTPQIFIAKFIESLRYYKPLVVWISIMVRLTWLLLGIATFLFAKTNTGLYVILFYIILALNGLLSGMNNNAWLSFIVRIIPSDKLSDFFSRRSAFAGSTEVVGAFISGIILTWFSFPDNYGYMFIIVFTILVVSQVLFNMQKEPKNIPPKTRVVAGFILDISNFFVLTMLSLIVMSFGVGMFAFKLKLENDK